MSVKNGVEEISEKKFNEIISKDLVVVDFFAEWCLEPNTKVIFNPGSDNIKKARQGLKVLSFDKNFRESYANIKSSHNIIHNKKIKITTKRGREIICTPEHLIHTKKGFLKAGDITGGDLLSVYLFSTYPLINNDKRLFLSEPDIKKTAEKLKLNKKRFIEELKSKNLLNLRYNNEKSYVLANLLGLLLSDGSLSRCKNNERMVEFFVDKESGKEVIKDLKFLGFDSSLREQEIEGKIGERVFTQKITRVRVSKTSLFILFASLGAIIGKKFESGLDIPNWILNGPKGIKKAFLQGFLGGDGPKITIDTIKRKKWKSYDKQNINPLELHFSKNAKYKPRNFAEKFSKVINEFGVNIRKIEIKKENRYIRKDKKISILLKIYFNTDIKSSHAYASIGFKYCSKKKKSSGLAREFLKEKIENLKKNPVSSFIPYKEWLKNYADKNNKIIFDKVEKINREKNRNSSFISLSLDNDTKMFVANDIIQHNCMPCIMMSPVIEEMAEKFKGKIEFAKVNIDDNPELAKKFNVMSIPTLVIFKKGKENKRINGAVQQEQLEEKLSNLVK